jgi:hypothetical protein
MRKKKKRYSNANVGTCNSLLQLFGSNLHSLGCLKLFVLYILVLNTKQKYTNLNKKLHYFKIKRRIQESIIPDQKDPYVFGPPGFVSGILPSTSKK